MTSGALVPLQQVGRLRVRQLKEWVEILLGWETKNKYAVVDDSDRQLLYAGEVGGFGNLLSRYFLGTKRPFTMELRSGDNQLQLKLERRFRFFFPISEFARFRISSSDRPCSKSVVRTGKTSACQLPHKQLR